MSMEVGVAKTDNHDDKTHPVSTTPDSGVCDPEDFVPTPPEVIKKQPRNRDRFQQTLDPFFYKYADNRKLTLLKSLSQDSEYSLDTSLFDAEEFLQDMGFAGSSDPTIPDRFLPSLMQRLSKFPESGKISKRRFPNDKSDLSRRRKS